MRSTDSLRLHAAPTRIHSIPSIHLNPPEWQTSNHRIHPTLALSLQEPHSRRRRPTTEGQLDRRPQTKPSHIPEVQSEYSSSPGHSPRRTPSSRQPTSTQSWIRTGSSSSRPQAPSGTYFTTCDSAAGQTSAEHLSADARHQPPLNAASALAGFF